MKLFVYNGMKRGRPLNDILVKMQASLLGKCTINGALLYTLESREPALRLMNDPSSPAFNLWSVHGELWEIKDNEVTGLDKIEQVSANKQRLVVGYHDGQPIYAYCTLKCPETAALVMHGDW